VANGTVQKGTDNVEDRTEDRTRKAQPPRPPEHRSMTVTVQAGDGVVGGDSSATATRGYGNGWTTRGMNVTEARQRREAADKAARDAAYRADKAARDAHRADLERNAYRMNAATQRRDAREARAREEARRAERAKTTIDAAEWEKAGQRNGQLRTEEVKNADGSLVMGADKKPVVKTFRNEGSMFDPTKNADAVAAVEKWWQDSGGQFTTGHGVPQGTFDKNGKLQAANLTSDQFAQLQRLQGAFDEKMAPIRQAQAMRDAQSYLKASELVQQNGVQVWDTRTGERRLSRDQVMEAARRIQTQSAYGALANLDNAASRAEGGRYYGEGGMDRMLADEQTVISRMRDLGFKANEITNDQGRLEVQRASAALLSRAQQGQAGQTPAAAPKATPRPAAKPAAAQPAVPAAQPAVPAAQPAPAPKPTAVPKAAPKAEVKPEVKAEVKSAVATAEPAQPSAEPAADRIPDETTAAALREAFGLSAESPVPTMSDLVSGKTTALPPLKSTKTSAEPSAPGFLDRVMARAKEAWNASGQSKPAMGIGMPGMLPVTAAERASPAGRKAERDAVLASLSMVGTGGASAGIRIGTQALGRAIGRKATGTATRAVARALSNPAVRGAAKETVKFDALTPAQQTLTLAKKSMMTPAQKKAADLAFKRTLDRQYRAAIEATKTSAEKTLDAVGKFRKRVKGGLFR